MQKRFYILFVARGDDGQLRKISIPVHYLYVFLVGASIVGLGNNEALGVSAGRAPRARMAVQAKKATIKAIASNLPRYGLSMMAGPFFKLYDKS